LAPCRLQQPPQCLRHDGTDLSSYDKLVAIIESRVDVIDQLRESTALRATAGRMA
jgi:hypothetical protein